MVTIRRVEIFLGRRSLGRAAASGQIELLSSSDTDCCAHPQLIQNCCEGFHRKTPPAAVGVAGMGPPAGGRSGGSSVAGAMPGTATASAHLPAPQSSVFSKRCLKLFVSSAEAESFSSHCK